MYLTFLSRMHCFFFKSKQISTNGLITFNYGEKTFEPEQFPRGQNPSIAPFWADINLAQAETNAINGGAFYQQIQRDVEDYVDIAGKNESMEYVFSEEENFIRSVFPSLKDISLTWMLIIEFRQVPPFVSSRVIYLYTPRKKESGHILVELCHVVTQYIISVMHQLKGKFLL